MRKGIFSSKRGLSEIVGYVLLISMTLILSVIVYQWIKTFVPREAIECDDGVSFFVSNYSYNCTNQILDLTVKNSGRFDVGGYFIHASTNEAQELAVTDLSETTENGNAGAVNYHLRVGGDDLNPIGTGSTMNDIFDLTTIGQIFSVQIVPLRYQEIDGKNRLASCSNAKITQKLSCTSGEEAEACVPSCDDGFICTSGQCVDVSLCGNGIISLGEQCDTSGGLNCQTGCICATGYIPTSPTSIDCVAAADLTTNILSTNIGTTGSTKNQITAQYSIINNGNANANNILARINAGTASTTPNPIESTIPSLTAETSQTGLSISWTYTSVGTYNPVINLDPNNAITESNENNNQASIETIVCSQPGSNIECVKQ